MPDRPTPDNPMLTFAARLHAGPAAYAAWSGLRDPGVIEGMLREGFDCAILDWQHGFHDFGSLQAGILAAHATGAASLVRIGVEQFAEAARFLDWGATGIIAPMINSVADARKLVSYVKYPPLGGRSWGPARSLNYSGMPPVEFLHRANAFTLTIAMIETREAFAALDDILAVDGIDGVLVGPSDLSITLTGGATVDAGHKDVDAALTVIARTARKHKKLACAFCTDGARAGQLGRRGYHLLSIANDQMLLRVGSRQELAKARAEAGTDAVDFDGTDGY